MDPQLYDATYMAARAQAESAYSKADQAKALIRPSLNLQASVTRTDFNSSATNSQVNLPVGTGNSYDSNTTTKRGFPASSAISAPHRANKARPRVSAIKSAPLPVCKT